MPRAETITATILGCGSSGGVPRIGGLWGKCDPANPKNRRRRCSLLLTGTSGDADNATQVLIDTGCDMREQLLDAHVGRLDAVLYTHEHADHTHGIDDLRVLAINSRARVKVFMSRDAEPRIMGSFGYCFSQPKGSTYPPILDADRIEHGETLVIDGPGGSIPISAFTVGHGDINVLGYRVGDLVYTPDINAVPDTAMPWLDALGTWVVDSLRYDFHPSHFSLADALDWIEKIAPRRAVLTNLHIDLDYETVLAETPQHVEPACDGLQIPIAF